MKHLKKIFERLDSIKGWDIEDIKNCTQDLSDEGWEVEMDKDISRITSIRGLGIEVEEESTKRPSLGGRIFIVPGKPVNETRYLGIKCTIDIPKSEIEGCYVNGHSFQTNDIEIEFEFYRNVFDKLEHTKERLESFGYSVSFSNWSDNHYSSGKLVYGIHITKESK